MFLYLNTIKSRFVSFIHIQMRRVYTRGARAHTHTARNVISVTQWMILLSLGAARRELHLEIPLRTGAL